MSDADFDLGGSPSVIDTTVSDTRPLEEDNVFKDINDYLDENTSSETIKCTKKCQKLFDDVMKSFHERSGTSFLPLDQIPVELLPSELARFFMVVKKKDGNLVNSSSLMTYYLNQVPQPNPQNIFQY